MPPFVIFAIFNKVIDSDGIAISVTQSCPASFVQPKTLTLGLSGGSFSPLIIRTARFAGGKQKNQVQIKKVLGVEVF